MILTCLSWEETGNGLTEVHWVHIRTGIAGSQIFIKITKNVLPCIVESGMMHVVG